MSMCQTAASINSRMRLTAGRFSDSWIVWLNIS